MNAGGTFDLRRAYPGAGQSNGQRIRIGNEVTITVVRITGGGVRIGIEAPSDLAVVREELLAELERADAQQAEMLGPADNDDG